MLMDKQYIYFLFDLGAIQSQRKSGRIFFQGNVIYFSDEFY